MYRLTPLPRETGIDRVFAGGDAVTGPASVIGAVASGRRAASAISQRLGLPMPSPDKISNGDELGFASGIWRESPAVGETVVSPETRRSDLEDAATISPEQALAEAGRCFNCGCAAVSPADLPPALVALEAVVHTDRRQLPAEDFFKAGQASSTALEPGEIVVRITVPKPGADTVWSFEKFRRREGH